MLDNKVEYRSGATVAQRAPIYIDVNKDPRARNQSYLNLYSSRVGAPVVAIDALNGTIVATSLVDGFNGLSGSGPSGGSPTSDPTYISILPQANKPPLPVTALVATRYGVGLEDIKLTFTWDPKDNANFYIDRFLIELRDSTTNTFYYLNAGYGVTPSFLNQDSTSQVLILSSADLSGTGIELISNIDLVGVATADILNKGEYVTATVPAYVSPLPQPIFTLSKGTDYYVVTLDAANIATAIEKGFYGFIVEELVTTETVKANVSLTTGWVQAAPMSTSTVPLIVYAPDDAHRWVRVKYISKKGLPSIYSDILDITPDAFMPVNTTPPTQFTSASIAWSGNDIAVTFAQPTSNAGTTIKVKLVPYINGSENSSIYAYYYHSIVGTETSFTIKSLDLYGQFGAYYSEFKGYITSVSNQGIETLGAVISSGPITRTSDLSSVYPTIGTPNVSSPSGVFRITSISNGYVVDFDMPSGSSFIEVYEKSSSWASIPTDDSNVVYSGLSPATVITPDYTKRYVIVRFYDQYGNSSHYSIEKSGQEGGVQVTPINVGSLSLIENPIKISTDGSIFAGAGSSTTYPQVFFNKDGIFAYDSSGNWTTEILNNATTDSPTFITKRALIGDWTIRPNGMENDSYVSGSTYTGMSASGTYAFWAGSEVSGGDANSKFSVTSSGIVQMTDVHILGKPDDGSNTSITIGGSEDNAPFKVTTAGALTASSATITGSITVDQQSYFNANVNISSGSYLISSGTGTVKVGSEGLLALNSSSNPTTKIYSNPISVTLGGTTTAGISLWSSKVLFGPNESSGWIIDSGVIRSDNITIDSANQFFRVTSTTSNSTNGVIIKAGNDVDYAIAAGKISGNNLDVLASSYFFVKHDGTFQAKGGKITGTLIGGSKTGADDQSHSGYYFDAGGSAIIGTGSPTTPQAIFDSVGIRLSANNARVSSLSPNIIATENTKVNDSAYSGPSRIELSPSGVYITGLPFQGDMDNNYSNWQANFQADNTHGYLNVYGLGPVPRQRAVVEDPVTGVSKVGFAIYYQDSAVSSSNPSSSSGYIGDLWVQY